MALRAEAVSAALSTAFQFGRALAQAAVENVMPAEAGVGVWAFPRPLLDSCHPCENKPRLVC